jgi:eukaryotic-like serine/threonine-protein kinase
VRRRRMDRGAATERFAGTASGNARFYGFMDEIRLDDRALFSGHASTFDATAPWRTSLSIGQALAQGLAARTACSCRDFVGRPSSKSDTGLTGRGRESTVLRPVPTPPRLPGAPRSDTSPTQSFEAGAGRAEEPLYLEPGSRFGSRYRIERRLGEGGMGVVYQAHDQELDRTVALKLLQPDRGLDPRALQRFKQELLLARAVSHRNILRIHDLGDVDGLKFISMDYVEGEDLHALIRRQGALPVPRALGLAVQLCAALQAAHEAGVLHRDLKPQNVLIGAGDHVYVSDFGLAKSLLNDDAGITRSGDSPGTPRYMSPEQVEGKPLDPRSDVYALGLILYEMVTGDLPFAGDSPAEQMFQRVQAGPRDPKVFNPRLPARLRRIILRCLARDPGERYASAREVLGELENVGTASPLPWMPDRRWSLAAVTLLLMALPFGFASVRRSVGTGLGRLVGLASRSPVAAEPQRIAVLPFRVAPSGSELAHLGPGVAESLSAKLFALQTLNVAPTSAIERAVKKDTIERIAQDLGARLIVTGSVQEGAGKLRLVVELEDVTAHQRIWTREFSFLPADLLTVEDQVYGELLRALDLGLTSDERARAEATATENVAAYELYLKARNLMRGDQDTRNVETAIGLYREALDKDARFALAYAGLANAQLRMYRATSDAAWATRAVAAVEQAKSVAEDLLEVRLAVANVYQATGKNTEALAELTRATALAPSSDEAYRRLGRAYLAMGRKKEALLALERAIALNPYHWVNYGVLGSACWSLGRYDRAADAYREIIRLEPDNFGAHNDLGTVYLVTGQFAEAVATFQKALDLQQNADTYTNLGLAYAYQGSYKEALPLFEKAVTLRPQGQLYVGNLGDAYRWLGETEKARQTYDRAIALGYKDLDVNPRDARAKSLLALHHAKKGDHARARRFLDDALHLNATDMTILCSKAIVDGLAGRIPEGLSALRQALIAGLPLPYVEADPNLAPLRADARYLEMKKALRPSPSPP